MIYSVSQETNQILDSGSQALESSARTVSTFVQTQPSCLIEGLSSEQRSQVRIRAQQSLDLQSLQSVPIFDEATQMVSRMLAMPICALSILDADTQHFKSVVGLSSLGLMNELASARTLPLAESFCTHVVDSSKTFALPDATAHPAFSRSLLVQQYGIQSYVGVPLFTTEGVCIGTLSAMDLLPHVFSQQEVSLLELSARWCMSEFEKQQLCAHIEQGKYSLSSSDDKLSENALLSKINQVRFDLVMRLSQDLRSPLTSITGMANMLSREIYGPLSEKQQEYTNIVLKSSQQLLSMVDEIVEVGSVEEEDYQLSLATVDIEMLGQQAIATLDSLAKQQELNIKLTVEPSSRLWNLDKHVVKQLLHHLVFSITKMSTAGSTIRLHISRKDDSINIALWVSNPWLGEDLPQAVVEWDRNNALLLPQISTRELASISGETQSETLLTALATAQKVDASRQELGLLLSRYLTHIHGGKAAVQGSASAGYRYVVTLPSLQLES